MHRLMCVYILNGCRKIRNICMMKECSLVQAYVFCEKFVRVYNQEFNIYLILNYSCIIYSSNVRYTGARLQGRA